jgi:hypothetical protein
MRGSIVALALVVSICSIALDVAKPSARSAVCRAGLCRFDQIDSSSDAEGITVATVRAVLEEDPANPMVWGAYGDLLAPIDPPAARDAWARAVTLGPHLAPVLRRAAQFHFAQGGTARALEISKTLLAETRDEDDVIFPDLLGTAGGLDSIPIQRVPARRWLAWLLPRGSEPQLLDTWRWLRARGLAEQDSASDLAGELWRRKSYVPAQNLWAEWLHADEYPGTELLTNRQFEKTPANSPFDWTLDPTPSVELNRVNGLDVRFLGMENLAFEQVHQFTVLRPGRYRFSAELETAGLTSDQRPFFHLFDPSRPNSFDLSTAAFPSTAPRSRIGMDFDAPAGTQAVEVRLERRRSARFDAKIEGRLHIYDVSLLRLSR